MEVTRVRLFNLNNKTAIVTGSSKGLGKSMALALAEAGANIVIISRNIAEAEQSANEVEKFGVKAIAIECDVSAESEVQATAEKAMRHFKNIDILVNNAGTNIRKSVLDYTAENWNQLLNVNLLGSHFFCKAVCPQMIERKKGIIINHASVLSNIVMPERAAYAATKAGLVQLTKYLAVELAQFNIRANAICTGTMETDMVKKIYEKEGNYDYFTERVPMKRIGQPDEIGGTVIFLASDASSFITGATIFVDGGYTAL
jgi:NAD(P)-dependent dehydrogenase (short-subunit alcohol dehydrogenase family)